MIERLRSSMMANFEIITASNGEEGLECFKLHNKDMKLILMDINMPVMNGYDCVRKIRDYEK